MFWIITTKWNSKQKLNNELMMTKWSTIKWTQKSQIKGLTTCIRIWWSIFRKCKVCMSLCLQVKRQFPHMKAVTFQATIKQTLLGAIPCCYSSVNEFSWVPKWMNYCNSSGKVQKGEAMDPPFQNSEFGEKNEWRRNFM